MVSRKVHGRGGRKGHHARERQASFWRNEKQLAQALRRAKTREGKRNRRLVRAIRGIAAPEIFGQWARFQLLVARRQVEKGKISQLTFYCKLLAMDKLFLENSKRTMEIRRRVGCGPAKGSLLGKTWRRDIDENINALGASNAVVKKEVSRQERNLRKIMPKSLLKSGLG
ncbi:MAG: hypothetical protein WC634_00605 [archaeon]